MAVSFGSTGIKTDIHTVAQNPLGFEMESGGNVYKYLQGVGSTAQYDWVCYDEAGLTIRMLDATIGPAAIAQAATLANQFGWYLVQGSGLGNAASAYADNATVNATATPGVVDDNLVATAAESQVFKAWGRSALSGSSALFQLDRPYKSLALLD